jgi:anti-sigma B factor antagonist/stage II sporulation protein AA (anti-sigma F factor antagonist)
VKTAKVSVQQHAAGPVICVRGEIDLSNSDALRGDILSAVPRDGQGIVLDLTNTTYLDSSGVRLLFELAELLQRRRQRLVLVVSEEALIRRVVVLTKLDDAVAVVESVDAGLAALAPV